MNHESELAKTIQNQYDKLENLIELLEFELFGYRASPDELELMFRSLSAIGFITIVDDNNKPILYENRLKNDAEIKLAKAIYYQNEIALLMMKGKYTKTIPLLTNAFGLTGSVLNNQVHHLKVKLNGTKGGQVHSKKKKDHSTIKEFWLKKSDGMTAKECATHLEKSGLVESTHGEILKLITKIKKELKNSSS